MSREGAGSFFATYLLEHQYEVNLSTFELNSRQRGHGTRSILGIGGTPSERREIIHGEMARLRAGGTYRWDIPRRIILDVTPRYLEVENCVEERARPQRCSNICSRAASQRTEVYKPIYRSVPY